MMLDKELRRELCRRVVELCQPERIILFGSYAAGNQSEESDLDLLVIKENIASKHRESVAIWQALRDIPLAKDIVMATPEEFEFYRHEPGSVLRTADEKGVVLYVR